MVRKAIRKGQCTVGVCVRTLFRHRGKDEGNKKGGEGHDDRNDDVCVHILCVYHMYKYVIYIYIYIYIDIYIYI
jgi:hypothetical protein